MTTKGAAKPRLLGQRAAALRARELRQGHRLPAHREAVLTVTGRLLVHFQNVSNQLYYLGEVRANDEPRVLLRELRELGNQVVANLRYVFPDGAVDEDVFSKYQRGDL